MNVRNLYIMDLKRDIIMKSFFNELINKAKKKKQRIVLPEGNDVRIIEAAKKITDNNIAEIILLGNEMEIEKKSIDFNINIDFSKVKIINPKDSPNRKNYSKILYDTRKHKGMSIEEAERLIQDETYYGVVMVHVGDADGMVSGAIHSTADTLRPALQIVKTSKNTKIVSTFFIMELLDKNIGSNGILFFADCGLNENPSYEELSEIALSSSISFKTIMNGEPKVAMLSYSTRGSAKSDLTEKVKKATQLVKEKNKNLVIDGEIQVDAAITESVCNIKAPNSPLAGKANILIFPDLNSGNIGYKLTERLGKAKAYGPITQGLAKPINDLSRGCNSDDIVGVVVITCLQCIDTDEL